MNKQREIIYGERRKILEGTDTRANFIGMVEHVVEAEVPTYLRGTPSRDVGHRGFVGADAPVRGRVAATVGGQHRKPR